MEGVCYVLCIDDNVKFQPKAPGSLEKDKRFLGLLQKVCPESETKGLNEGVQ